MTGTTVNVAQTARFVAKELGEGWSVQDGYWENGSDKLLAHEDGRKLHLTADTYGSKPGMVTIDTIYPHRPGSYIAPGTRKEISVNAGRGADVIAKEINRRLMPHYVEKLAAIVASNDQAAVDRAARDAMVRRVHVALNAGEPKLDNGDGSRNVSLYHIANLYGRVRVSYDGSRLDLDINGLSPEVGLEILRLLAKG